MHTYATTLQMHTQILNTANIQCEWIVQKRRLFVVAYIKAVALVIIVGIAAYIHASCQYRLKRIYIHLKYYIKH